MITLSLPVQILILFFVIFAYSRVVLRFRDSSLPFGAFLFWTAIWFLAGYAVLNPEFTSYLAKTIGIQRGADVVIYFSIILIFYLIFRTHVLIENLRNEITKLSRSIALKKSSKE